MESHEAKNTMKLLALVFISLAAGRLQGEREMDEDLEARGGRKRPAQRGRRAGLGGERENKVADGYLSPRTQFGVFWKNRINKERFLSLNAAFVLILPVVLTLNASVTSIVLFLDAE